MKLENSAPLDVTPTVNTGMPASIARWTMSVNEFESAGSIARQSICSVLSRASIWAICWGTSVPGVAGAMLSGFIGRIEEATSNVPS